MDDLRPTDWHEYIGQERLKRELDIRISSAIKDERPLDHVLLCGPPGAGKTSLGEIVSYQLGEPLEIVTMPITLRTLIQLVTNFSGVLVMDEIHRCSDSQQEVLLPLLEFGYVQDTSGRKADAEWLTVVGTTTEKAQLIDPLIDRFTIQPEYDAYTDEELALIVQSMAVKGGIVMSETTSLALGVAAAGTPRRARKFVLAYRDLANTLDREPTSDEVLDLCRTETDGLTSAHVKYIETLHALGGAKGLNVLCSLLRRKASELQEMERLLVEKGYLQFGDRGRELTKAGTIRARVAGGHEPTVRRSPRKEVA